MNSEFVISGKGQSALLGASWAAHARTDNIEKASATPTAFAGELEDAQGKTDVANTKTEKSEKIYSASARNRGPSVQNNDKMGLGDFVDIINPLQHIPLVNMAYRAITGDKISGVAQIAGGILYGGPIGIVSGVANAIVEEETGQDIGGTVVAMLAGDKAKGAAPPIPSEMPTGTGETMLASMEPIRPSQQNPAHGGLSDDEADKILNTYAAASKDAPKTAPATPVQVAAYTPAEESPDAAKTASASFGEQKFYSLEGVSRLGAGTEPKMPVGNIPDVRLKSNLRQALDKTTSDQQADQLNALNQLATVPLISKADAQSEAQKILGLGPLAPAQHLAGNIQTAPALPNGNPLPPQFIEDMMLKGLQKYQQNIGGTGRSVDIKG